MGLRGASAILQHCIKWVGTPVVHFQTLEKVWVKIVPLMVFCIGGFGIK